MKFQEYCWSQGVSPKEFFIYYDMLSKSTVARWWKNEKKHVVEILVSHVGKVCANEQSR